MGNPVDFEGANFIMAAPPGHEDDVLDLPVYKHPHGMVFAVLLDEAEKVKVAETGVVWVQIMSHSMPPIAVGAEGVKMLEPDGTERECRIVPLPIRNNKAR
jgi:hypothetical protein